MRCTAGACTPSSSPYAGPTKSKMLAERSTNNILPSMHFDRYIKHSSNA